MDAIFGDIFDAFIAIDICFFVQVSLNFVRNALIYNVTEMD